jgi:hypothetical protein
VGLNLPKIDVSNPTPDRGKVKLKERMVQVKKFQKLEKPTLSEMGTLGGCHMTTIKLNGISH